MLPAKTMAYLEQEMQQADPWNMGSNPYDKTRHETMLRLLQPFAPFRSALEVGCAAGVFTSILSPLCQRVCGLDIVPEAVKRCQARFLELPHMEFRCADVADINDIPPGSHDLIVATEVLYYFANFEILEQTIDKIFQWLAPGGYFLFGLVNDEVGDRWEVLGGQTMAELITQRLQEVDRAECSGSHINERSIIRLYVRRD